MSDLSRSVGNNQTWLAQAQHVILTEVIQDGMLALLRSGKLQVASGTASALSAAGVPVPAGGPGAPG